MAGECPSVELLAAYVEHAVTAEERAAVESHMARCRVCRETVAMTFKSLKLIKDLAPAKPFK